MTMTMWESENSVLLKSVVGNSGDPMPMSCDWESQSRIKESVGLDRIRKRARSFEPYDVLTKAVNPPEGRRLQLLGRKDHFGKTLGTRSVLRGGSDGT